MSRAHGWNRRGEALIAKAPQGYWKAMTFLAALRCDEITAPFVLEGPINGESFLTYVVQVLAPALKHGDIIVMDNSPLASTGARRSAKLSAPMARGGSSCRNIRQISIRSILRRAQEDFAKQKPLRKAEERTEDGVWRRIATLLECFSPTECANCFRNSGDASA
jgi:transposase